MAVILRPGKTPDGAEVALVLRHVVEAICRRWPRVDILVRGDSHYARQEAMTWLERNRIGYVFGLAGNPVLLSEVAGLAEDAALGRIEGKADKVRRVGAFRYAARSWQVVLRVEALSHGRTGQACPSARQRPGAAGTAGDRAAPRRGALGAPARRLAAEAPELHRQVLDGKIGINLAAQSVGLRRSPRRPVEAAPAAEVPAIESGQMIDQVVEVEVKPEVEPWWSRPSVLKSRPEVNAWPPEVERVAQQLAELEDRIDAPHEGGGAVDHLAFHCEDREGAWYGSR